MSPEKSIEIDTEFDLFVVEQVLLGKWDSWRVQNEYFQIVYTMSFQVALIHIPAAMINIPRQLRNFK